MTRLACVVALAVACGDDIADLRGEADAIARARQVELDALVARIATLKRDLQGNLPGWESMLRVAELANDELGLPPFTQTVPPGPAWRPSPASLLGIAPYVHDRARALIDRGELEHLVRDERARYTQGIAEVELRLAEVERWLASSR